MREEGRLHREGATRAHDAPQVIRRHETRMIEHHGVPLCLEWFHTKQALFGSRCFKPRMAWALALQTRFVCVCVGRISTRFGDFVAVVLKNKGFGVHPQLLLKQYEGRPLPPLHFGAWFYATLRRCCSLPAPVAVADAFARDAVAFLAPCCELRALSQRTKHGVKHGRNRFACYKREVSSHV